VSYKDEFPHEVHLSKEDITELQLLILEGATRDGQFKTRELLIEMLEKDVADYLHEIDYEPNMEWVNGVRYAIHIIKKARLE
jgi:hypothetical protein